MSSDNGITEIQIAGLLMAHEEDIGFLRRRLPILATTVDELYVHYDLKSSPRVYQELKDIFDVCPNIQICDWRENVHWGGDDQVFVQLKLLENAMKTKASHFIYLSSSHFPIKNKDAVKSLIQSLGGGTCLESKPMPTKQILIRNFLPFDKELRRRTRSLSHVWINGFFQAAFFFRYGRYKWGSNWSIIARKDATILLAELPRVSAGAYKYVQSLDEMFFQTILKNRCTDYIPVYFEFQADNIGHPVTFTQGDIGSLKTKAADAIYVRKVV